MIDKLSFNIRTSGNRGIFHDSREDVRTLTKALNRSIDKINELVEVVNKQNKEIEALKGEGANIPTPPLEGPPLRTVNWDKTVRGMRGW